MNRMKLTSLAALGLCCGALALAHTEAALAHRVAVSDHRLYLSCLGAGSPTVVMESGYGDASGVWATVQPQVATFARACVYDRAGLGRSDAVGRRSTQAVVDDLAALLQRTTVDGSADGPVILVGHSIGGLIATMLAYQAPHRVAGLVLVDSSHPNQHDRLRARLPRAWLKALDTFFADAPAFETWSSDAATAQGKTPYMRAGSLGDTPLVVLTRDVAHINPDGVAWIKANIWPGYSTEVDRLYGQAWLELQHEYLALSSRSTQITVEGSTHYIQRDRPDAVVSAVRQVVAATRRERLGVATSVATTGSYRKAKKEKRRGDVSHHSPVP